MRVKVLATGVHSDVVAVMEGELCLAESFLATGEDAQKAWRAALRRIIKIVADDGFAGPPSACMKLVDKANQIYEFKKGDLRLLFFKGSGRQIAVCVDGHLKQGQKVNKSAVAAAARTSAEYQQAMKTMTLEIAK